jgi:DEAD/DEAH box helicase domain-containing protein
VIDTSYCLTSNDLDGGRLIDSLGYSRAFYEAYEGAIYLHRGCQYLIHKLDLKLYKAYCKPVKVNYITKSNETVDVNILKKTQSNGIFNIGNIQVITQIFGFSKKNIFTGELTEGSKCSIPPLVLETQALWIDLKSEIRRNLEIKGINIVESLHVVNHMIMAVSPLIIQCDIDDIYSEHIHKSRML